MRPADVARRQVHLDFHTSAQVQGVGADFDATDFAGRMSAAEVQSVNVFAKCHHGFAYYPSTVGTPHPHLSLDLLGAQIEALHSRGIRAPIYVSVLWDDVAAAHNPAWLVHDLDGRPVARQPLSHDSPLDGRRGWSTLDLGSDYALYVHQMVTELCTRYQVDGFWFDIVWPEPNYSPSGLKRAKDAGVTATDSTAMYEFARTTMLEFMDRTSDLVQRLAPGVSVFYNGSVDAASRDLVPFVSHIEVESLPTSGQWGYLHYPTTVRHVRTLGLPTVGMTGRFHRSWSDFGGLKTADQLRYEVGTILSGGSAVSIGDQLHPNGRLDPAVYDTVATTFQEVAQLEPWLVDAVPQAQVAILSRTRKSARGVHATTDFTAEVQGAVQLLLECHHQFEIVDPDSADLDRYQLVIVPDDLAGDADLGSRLAAAHESGTSVLLSGRGGIDPATETHGALSIPATVGPAVDTVPCYVSTGVTSTADPALDPSYAYVLYDGANTLSPTPGATALGALRAALFSRQWDHFTGHAHAPVGSGEYGPWAATKDRVAIVAFPILAAYARHDYWVYKAMARLLIDHLLPAPVLALRGPSWVEATLHEQPAAPERNARSLIHLTAFTPRRTRESTVPRVDEAAAIAGLQLVVRVAGQRSRCYVAPDGPALDLRVDDQGAIHLDVPPIRAHTLLVIE